MMIHLRWILGYMRISNDGFVSQHKICPSVGVSGETEAERASTTTIASISTTTAAAAAANANALYLSLQRNMWSGLKALVCAGIWQACWSGRRYRSRMKRGNE